MAPSAPYAFTSDSAQISNNSARSTYRYAGTPEASPRLENGPLLSERDRSMSPTPPQGYAYDRKGSAQSYMSGSSHSSSPRLTPTAQPYAYSSLPSSGRVSPLVSSGSSTPHNRGSTASGGKSFALNPDPQSWGAKFNTQEREDDDYLHEPDRRGDKSEFTLATFRGITNAGCLIIITCVLLGVFCVWPILAAVLTPLATTAIYDLTAVSSSDMLFQLIDNDTPQSAYTHTSIETGEEWQLVFSDEFNVDGRTFYDGDDPYWQAEDFHYWSTDDLEWYDPKQVTTANGSLVITLTDEVTHDLNYTGGMMNSWNKFCFRGGYLEVNVSLPGKSDVYGLWPAIWTMGNLGRAGYGGTLESMWPYSYNSCDVGTLPNQTLNDLPAISTTSGDDWSPYWGELSYLTGQRLSACTCINDTSHPGPRNSDGTFVGRSAPEIDLFEAQIDTSSLIGEVSQSAQWAPFNPYYNFINNSDTYSFYDDDLTELNSYSGGAYQQSTSGVTEINQDCYEYETGCYSRYGFEYAPGDDGYVWWVANDQPAWTVKAAAMAANDEAEVGQRPVPYEPMYILMNLGISTSFTEINYDGLDELWPVHMRIDYVRLYQDPDNIMLGCDPVDMPTASYIALYEDAYYDANITTWDQITDGPSRPLNRLVDTC